MADTPSNPAVLSPALLRHPLVEPRSLLVTRPWARWLQASWGRQGGADAPSNAELDDGLTGTQGDLEGTQDDLAGTQEELGQTQADLAQTQADLGVVTERVTVLEGQVSTLEGQVSTLEGQVTTLQGQVASLQTTVTDHEARLDVLETWYQAVQAALPAVLVNSTGGTADSTVAALAALTATATVTALRDELNSALLPVLRNNYADLTVQSIAVRNALAA